MKISGRSNYKAGPKDECGSPPYAIVPLINHIELYRTEIGIPRKDFIILEPATGFNGQYHTGLVEGLEFLGYSVFALRNLNFLTEEIDELQIKSVHYFGRKIRMVLTNPPFSVALKRRFIEKCESFLEQAGLPYALLMGSTTLVEKVNGKTLRGCAVHIPHGRICYDMPNKGWGTEEKPTKATFETNWYSKGLTDPYQIFYSDFDMSDHFDAMKRFFVQYSQNPYFDA